MILNPNTKKAKSLVTSYLHTDSNRDSLEKCYKSCSNDKRTSFNRIWHEMKQMNGHDMRITGAGTYTYSCAYIIDNFEGKKVLIYHTACNRYVIPFST